MKRYVYTKLILMVVVVALAIGCQTHLRQRGVRELPPESPVMDENGSIPPGLSAALSEGGIVPGCIVCNSQNRYGNDLHAYSKLSAALLKGKLASFLRELDAEGQKRLDKEMATHLMNAMIRAVLIEGNNNNFGALVLKGKFWRDDSGKMHPLMVFRMAFTPDPRGAGSCYRSVLKKGLVKHVVNLYDGDIDLDELVQAEKEVAGECSVSYVRTADFDYGDWRNSIREFGPNDPGKEKVMRDMARLINEQILLPSGEPPKGNILIHCGGGMHRTGMVMGILQKVINGASAAEIKKTYCYHVGYKDDANPGGFEQENLDFINAFNNDYLH